MLDTDECNRHFMLADKIGSLCDQGYKYKLSKKAIFRFERLFFVLRVKPQYWTNRPNDSHGGRRDYCKPSDQVCNVCHSLGIHKSGNT